MKEVCFWSVGDGKYAAMLQALVYSFHQVGMKEDFVAISDQQIQGAQTFIVPKFETEHFLFKLHFLKEIMGKLDYRYFVYVDADSYFVRKFPDISSIMQGSPIHLALECDSSIPRNTKIKHWPQLPDRDYFYLMEVYDEMIANYVRMMRLKGITTEKLFTFTAGFFIVERESIDKIYELAFEFWNEAAAQGWKTSEEPALAYVMHKLCPDLETHTIKRNPLVWASDWKNHFVNSLPRDESWPFTEILSGEVYEVQPALVHCIVNKEPLMALGRQLQK